MFTNLLFLIIALLAIDLSAKNLAFVWPSDASWTFFAIAGVYCCVLLLIFLQHFWIKKKKEWLLILSQCELIVFLIFAFHIAGVQNYYFSIPYLKHFSTGLYVAAIIPYFFGLAFYYYLTESKNHFIHKKTYAWLHIRFLIPFLIPFFLYQLIMDVLFAIPNVQFQKSLSELLNAESFSLPFLLLTAGMLLFLALLSIFLPYFIQLLWECRPLPESHLKNRLEELCQKAHFKHAGLKIWTVMKHSITAAIIGIIPNVRYVMFTEPLLKSFPEDEVEAILAHELGHSHHKHLLFYPFLFAGLMILASIFTEFLWKPLALFYEAHTQKSLYIYWQWGFYLSLFIGLSLLVALYFRFLFGFISRNFERQADLFVFQLNLSAFSLIQALNRVAIATGYTHDQPSWHHGSIRQRIDFLKAAMENPKLIKEHHKKVKKIVISYFIVLAFSILVLIFIHLTR